MLERAKKIVQTAQRLGRAVRRELDHNTQGLYEDSSGAYKARADQQDVRHQPEGQQPVAPEHQSWIRTHWFDQRRRRNKNK